MSDWAASAQTKRAGELVWPSWAGHPRWPGIAVPPPRPKKELSSGQGEFSVDRCPQTLHYIPNVSPSCRAEDFVISLQEAHHLAPARASTDQLAVDELRSGLRDLPPKQVMYVCTRSDDISRNELTGNLDMAASTTNERQ